MNLDAKKTGHPVPTSSAAFTLVEVLVTVSILAVLATLSLTTISKMRDRADFSAATSNLRQVGAAMHMYSGENNGYLPGPLWTGQSPWYSKGDTGSLGYYLWRYLGEEKPEWWSQQVEVMTLPAYAREVPNLDAPVLVMNNSIQLRDGSTANPWGYPDRQDPYKMIRLQDLGQEGAWAMQDVDQTSTMVSSGAGWYSRLPEEPLHHPKRATLYFDGRVEALSIE